MLASRCGDHCTQKWFRVKPSPRFYPFTTTCMAFSSLVDVLLHPDTAENVNLSVTFWWSLFIWIRWPSDLFPEDQDRHHQSCLPSRLERKNPHFCVQNMSCSSLHQTRLSAEAGAAATVTRVCFYYVGGFSCIWKSQSKGPITLCKQHCPACPHVCQENKSVIGFFHFESGSICLLLQVLSLHLWRCPSPGLNQSQRSS